MTNPITRRRHALKQKRNLPRDASDEEAERLFTKITEEQNEALFGLMLDAGLRVSEVSGLQLADLDFTSEVSQVRARGKGGKERIVWLTAAVANSLRAWLGQRPNEMSGALFLNCWGRPITVTGIQYRLRRICQKSGVKITCHQLRHTYARRLVENGMPVESLARLPGHSHLASTQRYIEGADPSLQADFTTIMNKLETTLVRDGESRPLPPSYSGSAQP